jgi:competence protein ComEC
MSISPPSFAGVLSMVFGGLWLCIWQGRVRVCGLAFVLLGLLTSLWHKPYDVFISDDASKVAVRTTGGAIVFLKGRPNSFDGQAWLRLSGKDEGFTSSDMKDDEDAPNCTKIRCDLVLQGKHIAVLRKKKKRGEPVENLCVPIEGKTPDIVIAGVYMDRIPECQAVPLLIERAYLQQHGAVALRFENGEVQVDTANAHRGKRAWNTPPYSTLPID